MDNYSTFFSVVIPCFNGADKIKQCLESLLRQIYRNFEVIVVLDGCTDNTIDVVTGLRQKFESQGLKFTIVNNSVNAGPAKARNDGWSIAKGRYVAFLDADDEFLENKLEVVHQNLEQLGYPQVFGHGVSFDAKASGDNKIITLKFSNFLIRNRIFTPALIIASRCPERFNECMRFCEDYDLLLRLSYVNDVYYLNAGLTRLGRKPLTQGGASSRHAHMRLGEMKAYARLVRLNFAFILVVPVLLIFSALKYLRFLICHRIRIINIFGRIS